MCISGIIQVRSNNDIQLKKHSEEKFVDTKRGNQKT